MAIDRLPTHGHRIIAEAADHVWALDEIGSKDEAPPQATIQERLNDREIALLQTDRLSLELGAARPSVP